MYRDIDININIASISNSEVVLALNKTEEEVQEFENASLSNYISWIKGWRRKSLKGMIKWVVRGNGIKIE
mgnify:CR=1 FL=1|jgi:hypothetical protein